MNKKKKPIAKETSMRLLGFFSVFSRHTAAAAMALAP
jgi:hypothetical protein